MIDQESLQFDIYVINYEILVFSNIVSSNQGMCFPLTRENHFDISSAMLARFGELVLRKIKICYSNGESNEEDQARGG